MGGRPPARHAQLGTANVSSLPSSEFVVQGRANGGSRRSRRVWQQLSRGQVQGRNPQLLQLLRRQPYLLHSIEANRCPRSSKECPTFFHLRSRQNTHARSNERRSHP